jgi:hypothetical protein
MVVPIISLMIGTPPKVFRQNNSGLPLPLKSTRQALGPGEGRPGPALSSIRTQITAPRGVKFWLSEVTKLLI